MHFNCIENYICLVYQTYNYVPCQIWRKKKQVTTFISVFVYKTLGIKSRFTLHIACTIRSKAQTVIFAFHSNNNNIWLIQNHILLWLKLHICSTRKYGFLFFNDSLNEIGKATDIEKRTAVNNLDGFKRFTNKWHEIKNKILLRFYRKQTGKKFNFLSNYVGTEAEMFMAI